jgi:hypothetical protein
MRESERMSSGFLPQFQQLSSLTFLQDIRRYSPAWLDVVSLLLSRLRHERASGYNEIPEWKAQNESSIEEQITRHVRKNI